MHYCVHTHAPVHRVRADRTLGRERREGGQRCVGEARQVKNDTSYLKSSLSSASYPGWLYSLTVALP
jgi:hypothetical protein